MYKKSPTYFSVGLCHCMSPTAFLRIHVALCGRQHNRTPKCPTPPNLIIYYLTHEKGLRKSD